MDDSERERRERVLLRLGERIASCIRYDVPIVLGVIDVNAETIEALDRSVDAAIATAIAFGLDRKPGRIITGTPDDEVC